ncbi:MAG: hypothetical protein WD004_04435 [Actinomycetota bacterium]
MRGSARVLVVVLTLFAGLSQVPATAHEGEEHPKQVFLVLVDGASFEELMAVPEFRQLARAGGAGLLSVRTTDDDEGFGPYVTLGAGTRSAGPEVLQVDSEISSASAPAIAGVDAKPLEELNEGHSTPGLLGETLRERGFERVIVLADFADGVPGLLTAMDRDGRVDAIGSEGSASFNVYGADPARLAEGLGISRAEAMRMIGHDVHSLVDASLADEALVMVLSPDTTPAMDEEGDELAPIVMAEGIPPGLFPVAGEMGTLTSSTTHRAGVVSNEDVGPTILRYFDIPIPAEMHGAPIDIVRDARAPFGLHQRHLDARALWLPVQVIAGIVMLLILAGILACAVMRRRGSAAAGRAGAYLALAVPTIGAALLAAGSLPVLTFPVVVGFVLVVTFGVPALAATQRKRGELVPPALVGGAILIYLVIENAFGWPSMLTTFLGGTGLDGARFYGIPNVDVGLALGAAMWIVPILRTKWEGFVLVCLVGLLVGLPWFGANHEAAIFFAAGAWLALDGTWRRLTWRRALLIVGVTVAGLAVVFLADALASTPTHGTRFLQEPGLSGVLSKLWDRLEIGFRLLALNPIGIGYLIAVPVLLVFTIRPRGRLRATLEAEPRWRASMAVLLASGVVAYLGNDTGVSAVGFGFAAAAAGLAYVSLIRPAEKMGEP